MEKNIYFVIKIKSLNYIWAGYSLFPNASWPNLVKEWLRFKDDLLMRQTFINLVLVEPYEDRDEKALNEKKLLARCEVWAPEVPEGVAVLTAGVAIRKMAVLKLK
ncbi:terminase gpA endonuclease subunit [Arsenophonus endosymbiont of Bemisia tabaci]|uniref:terminase gpA endonuclease subunit n=1 Tax=Arsenophonus endosymbiont of Bemisia tabaci TaxID=536059 RepID=UPI00175967E9|nr:hypothetical protein ARSQ2_01101 [Arsenophonus endosymbiont of Bemisia tabaci Q2]